MLGRSASPKQAVAQKSENGQPMTLLTVVGEHARMEGKFEIADSPRPVYLVEEKRVGQQK